MVATVKKSEKKQRYSKKQALADEPNWSAYQLAIFDWIQNNTGNLRVGAVAGSGKTTSILGIVNRLPVDSKIAVCAFNVHIANALKGKVPSRVTVATAHGMGFAAINRYFRGEPVTVDPSKYRKIARELVDDLKLLGVRSGNKTEKQIRRELTEFLCLLVRGCQSTLISPTIDNLNWLINFYRPETPPGWDRVLPLAEQALNTGEEMAAKQRVIDFGDQLWLVEHWDLMVAEKDFLLTDEIQDANMAQLALYKRLVGGSGRFIGLGDKKQCLLPRTLITKSDGSKIPVEEIQPGMNVLSGVGQGITQGKKVSEVLSKNYSGTVIRIKTASGKDLSTTPNHIHFAGFRCSGEKLHFVYLMEKKGVGFRIGISKRIVKAGQREEDVLGFQSRLSREGADKIWILKTCQSEQDARWWECYYAFTYGIPTILFKQLQSVHFTERQWSQNGIDQLFDAIPTIERAQQLFRDEGLFYQYPHHVPKCHARDKKNGIISLCYRPPLYARSSNTAHCLEFSVADKAVAELLKQAGINLTDNGKGTGFRLRQISTDISALYKTLAQIQELVDVQVIEKARLASKSLPYCPASHIHPGMTIFVENEDGQIVEDLVTSVEKNQYSGIVYDLNVENTHNYSANGIFVHNCIMGFSFAAPDMWNKIQSTFNTTDLPLSVCYRCPTSHLDLARSIVPQIESRSEAPVGEKSVLPPSEVRDQVESGDLIICRFTAPLISLCLRLIVSGVQAKVRGRDIGSQLASLAQKAGMGVSYSDFLGGLNNYCLPQIEQFRIKEEIASADSLEDRFTAVKACYDEFGEECNSLKEFCDQIISLFSDEGSPVVLSTIHRAKGDEANRVFLLGSNFLPYTARSQRDWQKEQELCLTYVALTRAKERLFFVPLNRNNGTLESLDEFLKHPYGGLNIKPVLQGETKNTLIEGSKEPRSAVGGAASRSVRSEVKQEASKDVSSAIPEPATKDPEFCCLPFPVGSTVALKCCPLHRYTVVEVEPGVQTEIKAGENNPGHIAQPKEQGKVQHYYKLRTESGGLAHWWHHQLDLIA